LRVYNFARPGYFSTHERTLFERLITAGTTERNLPPR